nr:cytochrome P450 72A15-like [Ipomoea batatas]
MANFVTFSLVLSSLLLLSYYLARISYSILLKPKWLQRRLRQQNIKGTTYKLLLGDLKDVGKLMADAWSKPLSLTHDLVPRRVDPFTHDLVQKYGKISVCWFGTSPRLTIMDPEMIKEILLNKQGHFHLPPLNPVILSLARGLTIQQGETWAHHRRIMNPAFHMEKLKKNRRRNNLDKKITSMLRTLVETKEAKIRAGEAKEDDLLGLLLQSNNAQTNQQNHESNKKNYEMSMEEIIEECKQFYLAGHETTATWLTWTIIVLAMHQDWQQKAREEVLQVCGNKTPDPQAISHLKIVSTALLNTISLIF